eukprot:NODE_213_length_3223_cov_28.668710_g184_i0.p1 GENE.NODE_213_length_3223_cov_28.668710_g184_i0~~NODE_213_length_3223_cov_28.668710_g184_i0.p1  ORF type:complete len:990 (+),score=205.42 NODE_213_length_3223_cov_28.668710_g184_i0:63-3032(+)
MSKVVNKPQNQQGESVTVCVRLRHESTLESCLKVKQANNSITVMDVASGEEEFRFDRVLEGLTNYAVYSLIGQQIVKSIIEGYDTCVFAYGQTGSGKTYTMIGVDSDVGLIPRLCKDIFIQIDALTRKHQQEGQTYKAEVEVEYMEIYNEKIRDLFAPGIEHNENMKIRDHPKKGVYVEGLLRKVVESAEEIAELMVEGNKERTVAATAMNPVSSRSHGIFIIRFQQTVTTYDSESGKDITILNKNSCVNLVDLAGSERTKRSGVEGKEFKEAVNINKSLSALGNVIAKLAECENMTADRREKEHIPYRDTKLTWLLKESLGGNSKTIMVATVSPLKDDMFESLSTLRYAAKCKKIVNNAVVNEDRSAAMIRVLKEELRQAQATLASHGETVNVIKSFWNDNLNLLSEELNTRIELNNNEHKEVIQHILEFFEADRRIKEFNYRSLQEKYESEKSSRSIVNIEEEAKIRAEMELSHSEEISRYQSQLNEKQTNEENLNNELKKLKSELEKSNAKIQQLEQNKSNVENMLSSCREERDSELANALLQNQNKVYQLESLMRDKELALGELEQKYEVKKDELKVFKSENEQLKEEMKSRLQMILSILTEKQKDMYYHKFFNGSYAPELYEDKATILPNQETTHELLREERALPVHVPVATIVSKPDEPYIDPYALQIQEMLLSNAKKNHSPISSIATTPSSIQTNTLVSPAFSTPMSILRTPETIGAASPSLSLLDFGNSSPPPPKSQVKLDTTEKSSEPKQSNWDIINQKLIDMGYSEEDRAALLMSGEVDLESEQAVFEWLVSFQEQKQVLLAIAEGPPRSISNTLSHTPNGNHDYDNTIAPPISDVNTVLRATKSPKIARKEVECLIASQLVSPPTDDPSYCCQSLLTAVSSGVLGVKDVLRPLKKPLKGDPPHMQIAALNILEGLMKRGPMSLKLEVAGKKWTDRLIKAGGTPALRQHVQQMILRWCQWYMAEPQLYSAFTAVFEKIV